MRTRCLISQLNRIAARSRELSWPFFARNSVEREDGNSGSAGSKHYVSYSRDGNKANNDRTTENATRAFVTGMAFAAHSRRGTDRELHVRPSQTLGMPHDNVEIISLTAQSGTVPGKGLEDGTVSKGIRRNVRKPMSK